jgi:cold shock CspA family protein
MQATVLTFDSATGSGTIVADDGTTLPFDSAAFAAGRLRLLRPGQRVRVARNAGGHVESITVSTLALPHPDEADRT